VFVSGSPGRPARSPGSRAAPGEAAILHADLDAFYASVEQRDDPRLRGRPVVVGGGVVLAASYEAKARGVRTAMSGSQARRLCPDLVVAHPRFEAYVTASRAVFDIFRDTTPLVEGISIDEAFLDVGGLQRLVGPPPMIAAALRRRVAAEVGLNITVGVARTKFLAKVASGVAKPDGLLVVAPGHELSFLHPLPVERLWGVGAVTAAKLHAVGLATVGDVADAGESMLVSLLGRGTGHHLHRLAQNRDPRPVVVGRRRGSVGAQRALGRARRTADDIDTIAVGLVDRVTRRMRAAHRLGRTVTLRFRFDDYTRATRSRTLREATAQTADVLTAVRLLLAAAMPMISERGLTLLGLSVGNLDGDGAVQLELPLDGHPGSGLDLVLDDVRAKYGKAAVTRAVLLGREEGMSVPMLPD
jgi:DNA polymerase-4